MGVGPPTGAWLTNQGLHAQRFSSPSRCLWPIAAQLGVGELLEPLIHPCWVFGGLLLYRSCAYSHSCCCVCVRRHWTYHICKTWRRFLFILSLSLLSLLNDHLLLGKKYHAKGKKTQLLCIEYAVSEHRSSKYKFPECENLFSLWLGLVLGSLQSKKEKEESKHNVFTNTCRLNVEVP